jgi:hypothetical protein
MLLMRLQGNEQVVCQLLIASLCQIIAGQWQLSAGLSGKAAIKKPPRYELGGFECGSLGA